MKRILTALALLMLGRARARAALSEPHRERGRAVSGRRLGRRGGAAAGAEAQREHGAEFHRREPRRRRGRRGRRERGGEGRARRLHADVHRLDPHHHAVHQQQDPLRRREGFRAGVAGRVRAAAGFDRAECAGEYAQGILRSRAQGAGEIHLRDVELRLGRASGGRVAQARCRQSTRW